MSSDFPDTDIGRLLIEDGVPKQWLRTRYGCLEDWGELNSYDWASGSAGATEDRRYVELSTGATSGSLVERNVGKDYIPYTPAWTFDKRQEFVTKIDILDAGTGRVDWIATNRGDYDNLTFGFMIENGDLKGVTGDGTNLNKILLVSGVGTGVRDLRARFIPGSRVDFYVDGALEGSSESNLPSGNYTQPEGVEHFSVENTVAADRRLRFSLFKLLQWP